MDYSKYYTPTKIAETLIWMLDMPEPTKTIDICCGSCNLLNAAKKRWKNVQLWGVDLLPSETTDVNFFCLDGRQYSINCTDLYDLILANPPFERMGKRCEYTELYSNIFYSYSTSRLENEMLLANLNLLKDKGTLLIILPSTFIEGDTNKSIRKLLGNNYYIERIIRLPDDTFGTSNIKSYALIIKNEICTNYVTRYNSIENQNNTLLIKENGVILQKHIRYGEWINENKQIEEKKLISFRGKISSSLFCDKGIPVLHTSKKRTPWSPSIRYVSNYEIQNIFVENNDILISRIGKSAGSWIKYTGERMLISDCLIVIKDSNSNIYNKIKGKEFFHLVKGVATPYITLKDFRQWYSSL